MEGQIENSSKRPQDPDKCEYLVMFLIVTVDQSGFTGLSLNKLPTMVIYRFRLLLYKLLIW